MRTAADATSEIASGSKLGIDATKKLPGESRFHRDWPPLIRMDENVRRKVDALFKTKPYHRREWAADSTTNERQ